MGKVKATGKDDLPLPRRSSRIAKAKNTSTKKPSRCKKAFKNLRTGHHFPEERRH